MAKFCTKCGKKLEDGKPCSCEKPEKIVEKKTTKKTKEIVKEETEVVEVKSVSEAASKDMLNTIISIVKGIFIKPVTTAKKYSTEKNINLGYILIALAGIVTALFVTVNLSNVVEEINDQDSISMGFSLWALGAIDSDGDIEGIYDSILEIDDDELVLKTINVFIYVTIITIVVYLILIGSLYVILNKVLKKDINIKKILVTTSLVSTINTLGLLVALVLTFIITNLVMPVIAFAVLLFIMSLYQVLKVTEDLDDDKYPLMYTISFGILALVIYVLLQIVL